MKALGLYVVTNKSPTPLSRVLLEKLTVTQLVKKLPAFYGPQSPLLYSQEPSTGPYPETCIQSTPSNGIFLRSILILSCHLRLVLRSGLFPSGFLVKILHVCLLSTCATFPTYPIRLDLFPLIFWELRPLSSLT